MRTIEQPEVTYVVQMDSLEYQRGVCKIIYELAWLWLGDGYLGDPVAEKLRAFIRSGDEQMIAGRICMNTVELPMSLWNGERKAHVAMGFQEGDVFFVGVRVFDLVSGVVGVTNNAREYPRVPGGRFQLFDLGGGQSRNSSFEEEVFRMRASKGANALDRGPPPR